MGLRNGLSALAVALCTGASGVQAGVLVSNIHEPVRSDTAIGAVVNSLPPGPLNEDWYWAAQSFVTGPASFTLLSIDVVTGDAVGTPVVIAELRSDDNGALGGVITPLGAPDLTGAITARNFAAPAPITLSPNTTYWLVLGADSPGDGGFYWSYAETGNYTGAGALAAFAYSTDSGALWAYGTDFPWMIQVNGNQAGCPGDIDDDGDVDLTDLAILLANYGGGTLPEQGDTDGDGDVDLSDLAVLLSRFNQVCN